MPPAEFKPAIPASERPQTYPLDREATRNGWKPNLIYLKFCFGLFSDMGNYGPKRPERKTSRVDTQSPMPKMIKVIKQIRRFGTWPQVRTWYARYLLILQAVSCK
jgi:hypothetical protein